MGKRPQIIRPVEARIDLENIRLNVAFLKGFLPPGCQLMAVVKANAYGHGDIEVSRASLRAGADCLGVALAEEAMRLRDSGLNCPLYLLFEPPAYAAGPVISSDVICAVYTRELGRVLSDEGVRLGRTARVHIKVDTGMRRVGLEPDAVGEFADFLRGLPFVEVEGIYTHLAVAEDPSNSFTDRQLDIFEGAAATAEKVLGRPLIRHAANSAGVMAHPRSHYEMVRVGIAMLGLPPSLDVPGIDELKPVLSLVGEVAFVKKVAAGQGISYGLKYVPGKDTYIATIPLGYADGLSRLLSGKADVLIKGQRRPVVGTICMDLCMVDLGPEPVESGTPFVLIGRDGTEEITADEVAGKLGTINYEVVCMISSRVPRVHHGATD